MSAGASVGAHWCTIAVAVVLAATRERSGDGERRVPLDGQADTPPPACGGPVTRGEDAAFERDGEGSMMSLAVRMVGPVMVKEPRGGES